MAEESAEEKERKRQEAEARRVAAEAAKAAEAQGARVDTPVTKYDEPNLRVAEAMERADQANQSFFPAAQKQVDPNFQAGGIAAQTRGFSQGGQPLQTGTRFGEGALDVVPIGTPLMSVKGVQNPLTGRTQFVPIQTRGEQQTFHDLAGNAIDARQAAIQGRKQQLYNIMQGGNKAQSRAAVAELAGIERDDYNTIRQGHYTAMENAKNLEQDFKFRKEREAATQFSNLAKTLRDIPDNDPEKDNKVWQAMAENPTGARTSAGRSVIGIMLRKPEPTADQIDLAIDEYQKRGLTPTGVSITGNKATVRAVPDELVSAGTPVMKKAVSDLADKGLSTQEFASRDLTKVAQGTVNQTTGKFEGSADGDQMKVKIGDNEYLFKVGDYNRLNKVIPATRTEAAAATPAATPAATAAAPEVTRTTKEGRKAIFDAATKKFLRYAE